MVSTGSRLSSLSSRALGRLHPRWEPDAVTPLVRICGGGHERSWSLLRLVFCDSESRSSSFCDKIVVGETENRQPLHFLRPSQFETRLSDLRRMNRGEP